MSYLVSFVSSLSAFIFAFYFLLYSDYDGGGLNLDAGHFAQLSKYSTFLVYITH
jgi:hypothetical protein